jgi:ADP-dependent NAD(P)H-hydrate dehydratase / NAD(P)H-hydrate epimerase
MKVVTSHTMQAIDKKTINDFGIPGLELMENAGRCCVDVIIREFGHKGHKRVVILAGKGNNGGDGHVIARLLAQKGWNVKVHVLAEPNQISGDAAINLDKLPPELVTFCLQPGQLSSGHRKDLLQADLIVDALLGTGLNNNLSGAYQEAVELINNSGRPVLAVDIPSGINGTTGRILGCAVRADITVTFAFAKLGHVLYPGAGQIGQLIVADIGIPATLMESAPGYEFLNDDTIRPLLHRRDRQGHKGNFGHCLFIAGSTGKTGAAALCANSAVRTGSGLVTLGVPESLHHILEVKTTEAMTVPLPESVSGHLSDSSYQAIVKLLVNKDVLAIGPGIDRRPETIALVHALVESVELPMVIDADGLNALSTDISVLKRKKSDTIILTPHPGEMARLLGNSIPDEDALRISVAQEFARAYDVFLVLKGARTIIASPDGAAAINGSGNPGMASGGMGDVLTGIIASLVGQGYCAWDACRLGVFIHGYSADMVSWTKGEIGISATDVQENIPYAYKRLIETTPDITKNLKNLSQ